MQPSISTSRNIAKTKLSVPIFGFGSAHLGEMYALVNEDMSQQTLQEAKMCPTEVLAIITRAMETGQDNLKKQARDENKKVADPKMKKALDDLMDACPKFPALEEETPDKEGEGNEKVEGGEAKPDF